MREVGKQHKKHASRETCPDSSSWLGSQGFEPQRADAEFGGWLFRAYRSVPTLLVEGHRCVLRCRERPWVPIHLAAHLAATSRSWLGMWMCDHHATSAVDSAYEKGCLGWRAAICNDYPAQIAADD